MYFFLFGGNILSGRIGCPSDTMFYLFDKRSLRPERRRDGEQKWQTGPKILLRGNVRHYGGDNLRRDVHRQGVKFFLPISMAVVVLIATFSFLSGHERLAHGLCGGAVFGLASWVKAMIFGEAIAINPLVSLVPRLFVGISCFAVYRLALWLVKNAPRKINFFPRQSSKDGGDRREP